LHQVSTAPGTPETTAVLEGRTKGQERIRSAGGGLTRLLCRPVVTGLDNVPDDGGFIVASNHLSFLDSVLIQGIFPRPVSFIAKAEYFTPTRAAREGQEILLRILRISAGGPEQTVRRRRGTVRPHHHYQGRLRHRHLPRGHPQP